MNEQVCKQALLPASVADCSTDQVQTGRNLPLAPPSPSWSLSLALQWAGPDNRELLLVSAVANVTAALAASLSCWTLHEWED